MAKWFGRKKKDSDKAEEAPEKMVEREEPEQKGLKGLFKRGLAKSRQKLSAIAQILPFGRKLDEEALEQIETTLITADFGPKTAMDLTEELRQAHKGKEFEGNEIVEFVKKSLRSRLTADTALNFASEGPTVIVVGGVNGTGKTTSIAKIANQMRKEGKSVMLAAADTFRAAAVEQLEIWSDRLGVEMVKGQDQGDPAAVAYVAVEKAVAENIDVLIVDTAGRLHTQVNLMSELGKIIRVITKKIPDAPHEILQVVDATTGQNAVLQAAEFNKVMPLTGIVLTKLDSTARGGVIFPILDELKVSVKYVGLGEGIEDLQEFNPDSFVNALFD